MRVKFDKNRYQLKIDVLNTMISKYFNYFAICEKEKSTRRDANPFT